MRTPPIQKSAKTIAILAATAVIALIFFVLAIFMSARWMNDYKVNRFEQSLTAVDLPGQSSVIGSTSRFGLLWGNSNHCDVEVIAMVESDLSFEEFEQQFDSRVTTLEVPYPNAVKETAQSMSLYAFEDGAVTFRSFDGEMMKVDDSEQGFGSRSNQFLLDFGRSFETDDENYYYLLKATDQTFDGFPMNDWRCG